jgi:hypothetical protein
MNDPGSPERNRPDHEDAPTISDASLAALLADVRLPSGSAPQLRPLAESLALLTGRPSSDELDGEAATIAAFRREFGTVGRAHRPRRRREGRLRSAKSAAAVMGAALFGFGGLAAAAYAGTLPAPLQRLAHDIIAAPAPHPRPVTRPSAARPAVTGHSAYGLCIALARVEANGTAAQRAEAVTKLATAAGGADHVSAYCATVTHPARHVSTRPHQGPFGKSTMVPVPHGSGQPSGPPTSHGAGKPGESHGTGKPTGLPTPHGEGNSAGHPRGAGGPPAF